ncbi:hypothetical protein ACFFRR_006464 [Megaselia abdita]
MKWIYGFILFFILTESVHSFEENIEVIEEDFIRKAFFDSVLKSSDNPSLCQMQLAYFSTNYKKPSIFPMFDSWGKINSGLMEGNIFAFGNFDECINFKRELPSPFGTMEGQYCKAFLKTSSGNRRSFAPPKQWSQYGTNILGFNNSILEKEFEYENRDGGGLPLVAGICIPKSCEYKAIQKYLKERNAIIGIRGCNANDPVKWEPIDYVTISIISIIAILMAIGTIYDYLYSGPNRSQFLMAFSVPTNLSKKFHFSKTESPNNIDCLTGIRSLSMLWVIYGHTVAVFVPTPKINMVTFLLWPQSVSSIFAQTAFISVDTFFFMSGLLSCWIGLPELEKRNGKINVVYMYLHRYIRLTPMLGFMILFVLSIIKFFGNGPLYFLFSTVASINCKENWWQNLLYIQNYAGNKHICLSQSWYLAIDFQLFLISPLILLGLRKNARKCLYVLFVLCVLSVGCLYGTFYSKGMKGALSTNDESDRQSTTYVFTHTRYPIWMMGMAFGYFLLQTKGKEMKLPCYTQLIGWIGAFGILLGVVIAPVSTLVNENYKPTSLDGASYEAFSKIGWGFMLSWIIFCCYHGYGGVINSFLSNPLWQPLARLSFAMYLCHLTIMAVIQGSMRTPAYFSNFEVALNFWGFFGITILVSIDLVLGIESPIIGLEKMLLRKERKAE